MTSTMSKRGVEIFGFYVTLVLFLCLATMVEASCLLLGVLFLM